MKITIVTISFNQVDYLVRAIESVLDQVGADLEYIVVDAGSTDGSRDIIESYRHRLAKVIFESDNGPAEGLNKGFANATGDVYGFLNSDDELLPGALERVASEFDRHPKLDILFGCGRFVDENGHLLKHIVPSKMTPWLYAHGAVTLFQQGAFFRSETFRLVKGFNCNNRTCWDAELFLDMVLRGAKTKVISDNLAVFRIHSNSITGSGRLNKKFSNDFARLFAKAVGRPPSTRDILSNWLARTAKYVLDPSYVLKKIVRLTDRS